MIPIFMQMHQSHAMDAQKAFTLHVTGKRGTPSQISALPNRWKHLELRDRFTHAFPPLPRVIFLILSLNHLLGHDHTPPSSLSFFLLFCFVLS
jgi:hypothetical protein